MFIFGHLGITLGAVAIISGTRTNRFAKSKSSNSSREKRLPIQEVTGLTSLSRFLDLRLLMIGSLTPDIIDKPLAFFGFGGGRSVAHTLLVLMLLSIVSFYIYFYREKTWLLAIVIGVFSHLVLDFMWATPKVLFWPLFGLEFPGPLYNPGFSQIGIWINSILSSPGDIISESLGLIILSGFGWILMSQGSLKSFLIQGKPKFKA